MTKSEVQKFNRMHVALITISKGFQTPNQLKKSSSKELGLDYEEALEMSYENIQHIAKCAVKGCKFILS